MVEEAIRVNGETRPLRSRSLLELLAEMGLSDTRSGIAVAVNGDVVRRGEWATHTLRPGDSIEVVGAVQGG